MKSAMRECALLLMAFAVWAEAALARSYLHCVTKKVVIIDAPRGSSSSSTEENLGFWIDGAEKIITLADGAPLIVRRFDERLFGSIPMPKQSPWQRRGALSRHDLQVG